MDSPDFDIRESLIIHTGVNDIENRDMDCQVITDCFKPVVEMAKDKFRNAAIYLSEVTLRMNHWNGKVQEVNEKIKEIRRPWFKIISHSNLSDKTLFHDRKHLDKDKGVPVFALNLKKLITYPEHLQDAHNTNPNPERGLISPPRINRRDTIVNNQHELHPHEHRPRRLQPQDIQIPHLYLRTFADVAQAQNSKGALMNQLLSQLQLMNNNIQYNS